MTLESVNNDVMYICDVIIFNYISVCNCFVCKVLLSPFCFLHAVGYSRLLFKSTRASSWHFDIALRLIS